ncbi:Hypothetical predicted protein [Cloeon dipterum]|uniref:F-box domain-containing protein n=1 Tax=Cloeon dipterum TaxID=197152 RepID=A0A8S1D5L2_9INSE|nr:Hypothetical predicted protein [Cloeon dipterum]
MDCDVDYLSNLPIEIFLHICSYLDINKSLPALKCVCKQFKFILSDDLVWKSRVAGRWFPNEKGIEVDWLEACKCIENEASYLRDPSTCDQLVSERAHETDIDALHILENHKTIFTGSRDGLIKIWNINTEEKALEKSMILPCAHNGWIWRIESEDCHSIYSCSFDHSLKHWNFSGDNLVEVWSLDLKFPVLSIKLVNENVIAAGVHKEAVLVDRRTGTSFRTIFKDNHVKLCLEMINDNYLLANGAGKKICCYDLRNDKDEVVSFNFGQVTPLVPLHLATQQNIMYVADGSSKFYSADITKNEPLALRGYCGYDAQGGANAKVFGMFASYTSLIFGLNTGSSSRLAFWRTKPYSLKEEENRYSVLVKSGEMLNLGCSGSICSKMHYRDSMVAAAHTMSNDLVCIVPKEFM